MILSNFSVKNAQNTPLFAPPPALNQCDRGDQWKTIQAIALVAIGLVTIALMRVAAARRARGGSGAPSTGAHLGHSAARLAPADVAANREHRAPNLTPSERPGPSTALADPGLQADRLAIVPVEMPTPRERAPAASPQADTDADPLNASQGDYYLVNRQKVASAVYQTSFPKRATVREGFGQNSLTLWDWLTLRNWSAEPQRRPRNSIRQLTRDLPCANIEIDNRRVERIDQFEPALAATPFAACPDKVASLLIQDIMAPGLELARDYLIARFEDCFKGDAQPLFPELRQVGQYQIKFAPSPESDRFWRLWGQTTYDVNAYSEAADGDRTYTALGPHLNAQFTADIPVDLAERPKIGQIALRHALTID